MTTTTKVCRKTIKDLRACVTVRCCGHMHKIGLSHNGQLVLFDHTKDEVQRYLTLYELGADPSRCVAIYRAWTAGTIDHAKHPEELSAQRFPHYDFAKRVQRKLRRNRLKAMLLSAAKEDRGELLREFYTLVGPGVEQKELVALANGITKLSSDKLYESAGIKTNWFTARVISEMTRRGWPSSVEVSEKPPSDDDDDEASVKISMVFDGGYSGRIHGQLPLDDARRPGRGQYNGTQPYACDSVQVSILGSGHGGYTRIATASDVFVSSFADYDKAEDILLQLAADVTEVGYVNELLRSNIIRNRTRTSVYFANLTEKTSASSKIRGLTLRENEALNIVSLTIQHDVLTIQAAQLLIDAYRTIEPKVLAILRMNAKRLAAKHRVPPTPEENVTSLGQPVPKKLKKAKLPVISKEEEVDDVENSIA